MKPEDVQAINAFANTPKSFLALSTGKDGSQNLTVIRPSFLGRVWMWICIKLGGCHRARFDNVIEFTLSQLKTGSLHQLPSITALNILLTKVEHYNKRHHNKLSAHYTLIKEKADFLFTSTLVPTSLKIALPTQPEFTSYYSKVPDSFRNIGIAIENSDCSETFKSRARFMVQDLGLIEANLPYFKSLKTDPERSKAINRLATETYGRSAGEEEVQAYQSLVSRNELFLSTFDQAKQKGKLKDFISAFTVNTGGPCLTGRTEGLQAFAATLSDNPAPVIPTDSKDLLILPTNQWTERLLNLIEHSQITLESITQEYFKTNLLENIDQVVKEFEGYEDKKMGIKFLDFLEQQKIYKKGTPVDWDNLIRKVINCKSTFTTIYNYTILFTKESLNNFEF